MNITVMEDPGLPVGMTATSMASGTQLRLSWSPRAAQQGMIHELVIIGSKAGVSAYPWRFRIPVAPPAFSWITPGEEGGMATAVVGSPSSVTLKCHSNYRANPPFPLSVCLALPLTLSLQPPRSLSRKDTPFRLAWCSPPLGPLRVPTSTGSSGHTRAPPRRSSTRLRA